METGNPFKQTRSMLPNYDMIGSMNKKVCGKCKLEKAASEFSLKNGSPQWQCKDCHRQYRKEHYKGKRSEYVERASKNRILYRNQYYEWLKEKSCVDCGTSDIRVLELDHLSDKSYSIASRVGRVTLETLMKEIKKCEVVCCNCHRIRTVTRGGWTRASYAPLVQ